MTRPQAAGLFSSGLLLSRQSLRTSSFVPSQTVKEVMLEKPLLNPLSHFLGGRKQYRKRGSNTECFWKYCV